MAFALLCASLAALVYDGYLRYRLGVRQRLKAIAGDEGSGTVSLFKDLRRFDRTDEEDHQSWHDWAQVQLELACVGGSVWNFAAWWAVLVVVMGLVGAWWSLWLAAALAVLAAVVPFMVLRTRQVRSHRIFVRQLPEAFSTISRAVRSGQTISSAMQIIANDFPPPLSTEFARCYEQQNLGITRESSLRQLARRKGIMELQLFVVALLVQARAGGNLVELLDNLANMIRKRLTFRERVRALTSEGRMQAVVLLVLPLLTFAGLQLLAPDYIGTLLERPWVLAGTAVAQIAGVLWIRQIVSFEY
ncbi:type II secretion system F family protein [Aeoliella sp. SH292]|uniref:type II secretion system F family protein n=1 Tax=Aeoliella sp. SH292 TaxID=3454464 RepID=UPI003F9D4BCA